MRVLRRQREHLPLDRRRALRKTTEETHDGDPAKKRIRVRVRP